MHQPQPGFLIPTAPPAVWNDTPSRHPCKISVRSSEKRRFQYNPYKGLRAPTLTHGDDDDEENSSEGDDAIAAALRAEETQMRQQQPQQLYNAPMAAFPAPIGTVGYGYASAPASFTGPRSLEGPSVVAPAPLQTSGVRLTSSTFSVVSWSGAPAVGSAHLASDGGCMRMVPGSMAYVNVRFKFSEATFFVPVPERAGLAVGDLIVVQGDRGEDIGIVTSDATFTFGTDPTPGKSHVLRRALNKDRKRYFAARRKETYAAGIATDLSKELKLNLVVLDCEFQADLQKLTVFYRPTVEGLIDFRQLQRSLFKQFRCRIWLLNWDSEFQQVLEQHRLGLMNIQQQ